MFELSDLKQTRFYQEAMAEGEQKAKLQAVPELLEEGLGIVKFCREYMQMTANTC